MRKVFAELYKGYIKLYNEKPSIPANYDVKEVEIPDGLDGGRVFVGLSVASVKDTYGYGISLFHDIHEKAQKELGNCYNEIEFNTALLSRGWRSTLEVQDITNEYIADTKFKNGIK